MRLSWLFVLGFSLPGIGLANAALAQKCELTEQCHAKFIQGETGGDNTFRQRVNASWTFSLEPAAGGWDLRLRDADNMDLSQITPPFRNVPNSREIYSWHFRNAANTGKNTGDVNAPQHLRLFEFSPSLTGTGGFRPPLGVPALDRR